MTNLTADLLAQLPGLVVYGLGALVLLIAGVAVFVLLEGLYLVALGLHLAGQSHRASRPHAAVVLALVATISGAAAASLTAQGTGQQVRTVEPRLTRLFSSDSMMIDGLALSHDGRWIIFSTYEAEVGNLWVVSATGGEPVRLTTGRHTDGRVRFFPAGDRIAFVSDRPAAPGSPQRYVMAMPFDSRTGRAAGPPRQVSLEPAGPLAVSPDGEWIAYGARQDTAVKVMVMPSSGGTARELARFPGPWGPANLAWSADGASVYFTIRRTGTETRRIMRVPAAGGRTEELGTAGVEVSAINVTRGLMLLHSTSQMPGPGQEEVYEIATLEGGPVARFAVPRDMRVMSFTPDGRGLLAGQANIGAAVRVVPLAGGPARQLTEARGYDWPIGWSTDGSYLYVVTRANGRGAILQVPVNGDPLTQWLLPAEVRVRGGITPDGRYVAYGLMQPASGSEQYTLVVRRLADGQTRVVTRAAANVPPPLAITGPGGGQYHFAEFFYLERRGTRLELWATPPEGPSRLLRAFPASFAGSSSLGVHGNRIAYTERRGDSTLVLVADGPNGRPRHLATVAGSTQMLAWSHDGRWLAVDYYPPGQASRYSVLLLGVGPDGDLTAAPRVLDAGPQWGWQVEWLPDDRAFTAFGMTGQGNQTHVFLVSLREGERPVALTRDDPSTRWGYELSPDGRYVAYPAEILRGSSIWRVDLGDVLAGAGTEGSRRRQ